MSFGLFGKPLIRPGPLRRALDTEEDLDALRGGRIDERIDLGDVVIAELALGRLIGTPAYLLANPVEPGATDLAEHRVFAPGVEAVRVHIEAVAVRAVADMQAGVALRQRLDGGRAARPRPDAIGLLSAPPVQRRSPTDPTCPPAPARCRADRVAPCRGLDYRGSTRGDSARNTARGASCHHRRAAAPPARRRAPRSGSRRSGCSASGCRCPPPPSRRGSRCCRHRSRRSSDSYRGTRAARRSVSATAWKFGSVWTAPAREGGTEQPTEHLVLRPLVLRVLLEDGTLEILRRIGLPVGRFGVEDLGDREAESASTRHCRSSNHGTDHRGNARYPCSSPMPR